MVTNLSLPDDCCIFASECFKTDKTQFDLGDTPEAIKINGPPMLVASLGRKAAGDRSSMRFNGIFARLRASAQAYSPVDRIERLQIVGFTGNKLVNQDHTYRTYYTYNVHCAHDAHCAHYAPNAHSAEVSR